MVTINYRLNIFGSEGLPSFLSDMKQRRTNRVIPCLDPKSKALTETSLTLLDVRAAVEWVSENIEAFGGDPENIMVSLWPLHDFKTI